MRATTSAAVTLLVSAAALTLARPALAQPADAPAASETRAAGPDRPERIPYDEDEPDAPPGYRLQTTQRTGMAITGAVLTSIGTPFFLLGAADCADGGCILGVFSMFVGTALLGPGLPLLLVGTLKDRKEWVRDEASAARAPTWTTAATPRVDRVSMTFAF